MKKKLIYNKYSNRINFLYSIFRPYNKYLINIFCLEKHDFFIKNNEYHYLLYSFYYKLIEMLRIIEIIRATYIDF